MIRLSMNAVMCLWCLSATNANYLPQIFSPAQTESQNILNSFQSGENKLQEILIQLNAVTPDERYQQQKALSQVQNEETIARLNKVKAEMGMDTESPIEPYINFLLQKSNDSKIPNCPFSDSDKMEQNISNDTDIYSVKNFQKIIRQKNCSGSVKTFSELIKNSPPNDLQFENAATIADKIAQCYGRALKSKSKAMEKRIQTLDELSKKFKDVLGEKWEARLQLKIGFIYWNDENFTKALEVFNSIEVMAENNPTMESVLKSAILAKAQLYDEKGSLEEAAITFAIYLEKFPNASELERALTGYVTAAKLQNKNEDALNVLLRHIDTQWEKPIDQRDAGSLTFALFWAGKIYFEKKEWKLAQDFWVRLIRDYYSTFYGAMAQHLLERMTQENLVVPVSNFSQENKNNFDYAKLKTKLNPEESILVQRSEALLKLGFAQDAFCELKFIKADSQSPDKLLIKSILAHAAGYWLEAVKYYDQLPRSYRNTLPYSFEKIIFPLNHFDKIQMYSESLGIDPFFSAGIIRQESVFNPRAASGAGAKGLMQLMNYTARMEAKHFIKNYMSKKDHQRILAKVQSSQSLFDPEVNLSIGTHHLYSLLKKYQNSVIALSAYNANPMAAKKWVDKLWTDDMLIFLERIPFKETRAYVKLVLRNYYYYKKIYGNPSQNFPQLENVVNITKISMDRANLVETEQEFSH